jgi:predicted metal-dependent enzyme (double-stranded beta helix superfamily)
VIASVARLAESMGDDEFVAAMERFTQNFLSYRDLLPLIPYAYTRTRLLLRPKYEVVVMRWSPGSTSPIHDHGNSRCWVLMLEGALEVENYERDAVDDSDVVTLRETGRIALRAGDVDFRGGHTELHRVHNTSSDMAYSLQLYNEPIEQYSVVDAHSRQSRIVTAMCDLELPEQ